MPRLRNVVLAGHSDSGKTTLAEHLLHATGAVNAAGQGRRRDGRARLRARGAQAQAVARRSPSRRSTTTATRSRSSTRPAMPTSPARSSRASRQSTRRSSRWTRPAASRPAPRRAISLGREHGTAAHLRHHPVRARERRPDRPRSTRCARRSATRSRRCTWPSARPIRSRATSTSCTARRTSGRSGKKYRDGRSRPSSQTRSRAAATSCSRRPPRPTTTS